jgi:quercetin dioxygenase-like cupin family protein
MYKTDIGNPDIIGTTSSGKRVHWLVTAEVGAPNFEMRYVEIAPGAGPSKTARHPHEHEVYVVSGRGLLTGTHRGGSYQAELRAGDAVFIPGGEEHQWLTPFGQSLAMICVVPKGAESELKPEAVRNAGASAAGPDGAAP